MICGFLVSSSVIILPMDLLKEKARKKKFHPLYFVGISIDEYKLSPIENYMLFYQ